MSLQVRSSSKSRGRRGSQKPSQPVGPVVAQQPSGEQPEKEEPPAQRQDVNRGQKGKGEGASAVQGEGRGKRMLPGEAGPDLGAFQEELAQPETGGERGDRLDVNRNILPDLEPIEMPEAGEGQPQI